MLWWLLSACTTNLHVVTSMPEAEIGVLRSTSQPPIENPSAEIRGKGELQARVSYSILDTWWVWVRAPGGEASIQRYPTELAVGPMISCASGVLLLVPLIGCLWVSRPVSHPLHVEVLPTEPPPPVPAPSPPAPTATGCSNDTDCKGERICEAGACIDPA